jgi:hypothetical protein
MSASINSVLTDLSSRYYISHGTTEQKKIDASVDNLKINLKRFFSNKISELIEFGSYKRDTILPREYDAYSDVDLMVVFNHSSLQVSPGTYRSYLIDFADKYYKRSDVKKTSPTVTLELDHIMYDLVPAYKQTTWFSTVSTINIPQNDTSWMETDPHGFTQQLTTINSANKYLIKPLIRLLKAWNAKAGFPYPSFKLEQEIASMFFWGCTTLEDYFFNAIYNLNPYNIINTNGKILSLKENANKVKANLQANNLPAAHSWLASILPL